MCVCRWDLISFWCNTVFIFFFIYMVWFGGLSEKILAYQKKKQIKMSLISMMRNNIFFSSKWKKRRIYSMSVWCSIKNVMKCDLHFFSFYLQFCLFVHVYVCGFFLVFRFYSCCFFCRCCLPNFLPFFLHYSSSFNNFGISIPYDYGSSLFALFKPPPIIKENALKVFRFLLYL